jgi:hypothetical protein
VGAAAGNVTAYDVTELGTSTVTTPVVAPAKLSDPAVVPAVPNVNRALGPVLAMPTLPASEIRMRSTRLVVAVVVVKNWRQAP